MRTFSEVLVKWNFQQGTLILVYITIPESFLKVGQVKNNLFSADSKNFCVESKKGTQRKKMSRISYFFYKFGSN